VSGKDETSGEEEGTGLRRTSIKGERVELSPRI